MIFKVLKKTSEKNSAIHAYFWSLNSTLHAYSTIHGYWFLGNSPAHMIIWVTPLLDRGEYYTSFCFLDAADYYMEKEGLFILHEDQKVHLAINRLGLTTLSPFNAR